jgi:hypothetical protein
MIPAMLVIITPDTPSMMFSSLLILAHSIS